MPIKEISSFRHKENQLSAYRHYPIAMLLLLFTLQPIYSGTIRSFDRNEDGAPDEWLETLDENRYRLIKDRNFDGDADYAMVYDENGTREYEELDYNYDGMMDDFYYYSSGVLQRRELDTNYDEIVDLWVFLDEGVYIKKILRDLDYDGEADMIKNYDNTAE